MARIGQDVVLGGRYRLLTRIATGGMGTLWEAEDAVLRRRVAVKVLSDSLGGDEAFVERFRREAQSAAGLSHPNVAGVFDYGEDADTPFIVMELIEGENLAERMARTPRLPPADAARIAAEVAEGLGAAHAAGVVHRDVKPGNIMIDPKGTVRVLDFGIAAASWAAPITATGTTLGTASYLSPEQARGEKATPASDVYALGCVLYEMLTGAPPFSADSPVALAAAHARETPVPVSERAPGISPELAAACDRALDKDPAARPSAEALAQTLKDVPIDTGSIPGGAAAAAVPPATTRVVPPEQTAVLPTHETRPAPRGTPLPARVGLWAWWIVAALAAAAAVTVLVFVLAGGESPPAGKEPSPAKQEPAGITVPKVVGLPFDDAVAELAAAGIDEIAVQERRGEPGIVMAVRPEQGSSLSADDTVTLVVGVAPPEEDQPGKDKGKGNGKGKGRD